MSIDGSSATESFSLYMKNVLSAHLEPGQIVLMDNLSVHKIKWVRDLIEGRGCQLWLLPSYSPELNPIERPSPRSRRSYAEPAPGLARPSSRRWAKHYPRSASWMPRGSSSTPVTILRLNYHETCCQSLVDGDRVP
jgi:transposase